MRSYITVSAALAVLMVCPVSADPLPIRVQPQVASSVTSQSSESALPIAKVADRLPIKPALIAGQSVATESDASSPAPIKATPAEPNWEIKVTDITLSKTFERWADTAGYRIRWDARKHILVEAPDVFVGSFEHALKHALSSPGVLNGDYPLEVCIYPNNPKLARVTRQGEQVRDCPVTVNE